jgi:hypothetical protein
MTIVLPEPIAAYFAADGADGEAVAHCFTVKDEGQTYVGRAALAAWKTDASTRCTYSSEAVALDEIDGKTIVTCHLVGDFPGNSVDLRFFFRLQGDKIAALEIIP